MKTYAHEVLKIAVVIPCYRVSRQIVSVVERIPDVVWRIYIVDDACPDSSGSILENSSLDERIRVLYHSENRGVGGAVITGYQAALEDGAGVIVKIDGDGQMDPELIPDLVAPIMDGTADYTKGNRFFNLDGIGSMPMIRLFGNAALSLMTKLSSGYWNLFDPTNGFTAIHSSICRCLPFDKISKGYFFETDMLFRLNILRAVVVDVPIHVKYGEEISNLRISRIIGEFWIKHLRNLAKRIFYSYYLRDLSLASFELPIGVFLLSFGIIFGGYHWYLSAEDGVVSSPGTVMLAALPILMGIQFILAFIGYDIYSTPQKPQSDSRKIK